MNSLAFVIHELKPWGGHDRSTLEVVRRTSRLWPVEIVSYMLIDPKLAQKNIPDSWGQYHFKPIRPYLLKPALLGLSFFYLMSWVRLWLKPRLLGKRRPLIHATGSCSLVSDIVQVQFVSAAWNKRQKEIQGDIYQKPHARAGNPLKKMLRSFYRELMLSYNLYVERKVYSKHKTYIAIAHCVAQELEEHFGIKENVHIIHHGVDSEMFKPSPTPDDEDRQRLRLSLGVMPDEVAISFVGEFERKGLAVAIDAVAQLEENFKSRVKLLAIGGSQAQGFKDRAKKLGIEDRVVFVSLKKEIAPYYQASDLFLMPTLYEPFGLVILEAMATGLPSIVSKIAGGAELIEDGINGKIIHDPSDSKEVSLLLSWILSDDERRLKMGAAARTTAVKRSWDQVAAEYAAVIKPLLEAK